MLRKEVFTAVVDMFMFFMFQNHHSAFQFCGSTLAIKFECCILWFKKNLYTVRMMKEGCKNDERRSISIKSVANVTRHELSVHFCGSVLIHYNQWFSN